MIKEKHTLTNPYNHHALSRYIDVYEVTTDGCSSSPMSGYKGTEATLVDEPAWNEKFSSYSITGATLTGNNFVINNDVTAKANYETAKNVTTIRCNSTKNSGFIGDTASLTNSSPAWNEKFSSYSITGSTLTGSNFKFTGSNITAQANFETAKNVTLQTDGHGTIASTKSSGFINDTATLSNTASNGYGFSGYSITGATLTGNKFNFIGNDVTAKAWFSAIPVIASATWGMLGDGDHIKVGNSVTHTCLGIILDPTTTGVKVSATFVPNNTAGVNQIHDKYRWSFDGKTGFGNVTDFYVTEVFYHGYFNEIKGSQTANINDYVFAINGNSGTSKTIIARPNNIELYYTAKYNSAHFVNPVISLSNQYLQNSITASAFFTGYVYV